MAISRLWQSGAELNELLLELTGRVSAVFIVDTAKAKTGTYSYRGRNTDAGYKTLDSAISQCRVGGFINHVGTDGGIDTAYIFTLSSGATPIISLAWDEPNGLLKVFAGNNGQDLLASASSAPFNAQDTWYHVGFDVKIHASGWAYVYIDGVEVIGFSGDTTLRGATFNRFYFNGQNNAIEFDAYWANYPYYDDLYVDDTTGEGAAAVVPSYRFDLINPNGNGYSSDFNGSDGNQVDNYLLVDEIPHDGDTTYVTQNVAAENDGYLLENISLAAGEEVSAVLPIAVAKKVDAAGSVNLDIGERLGGVNSVSSPAALGTDYVLLWERHTTKPGGGAWDESDVNSAEVVLETA